MSSFACRLFAIIALAFLAAASGCASPPAHAAWNGDEKVIQPMADDGTPSGSLVAETVFLGTENGNDRRHHFFLYDEKGTYLTHYPNNAMMPVTLPPGRYVVVTSIMYANKRVQVVIKGGQTTTVRLTDFKSAPEAE